MSLRDVSAKLRRAPEEIPVMVAEVAAPSIERSLQESVPVRTGALRDSISVTAEGAGVRVDSSVDYAVFFGVFDRDHTEIIDAAVREVSDAR